MTDPPDREVEIFNAVLQLPAAERSAYLDSACAGDSSLRERIELLLRAEESAGDFLRGDLPGAIAAGGGGAGAPGPANSPAATGPASVEAGDRVGRYKLLQQIGEGGCGVVYMAEQEEPVRRRVALKVIKLGMDTKSVIARFEAERQALALMDHSNIARVLDAGSTDSGRPYFVMELVRGVKITDYCDENRLPMRARLELFVQVCQAVQHAHQKGIIHRDLKPSNILVTVNDGAPVPKVIDFGIAKATQGRLTDRTLFTAFDQFVGTPAYMSPEQAVMTSQDVDTRSDIYSLGVLLYELLTGRTPFDGKELLEGGLDLMRRTILEKEPLRPSTRLRTMLAAELTTTARCRRTEPPKLIHLLRGDLDWIVMKALEKERARRYETANGLAMDIRRYLGDEPVTARPPSNVYRLRKMVRRNKLAFAAAAAVLVALVIGLSLSMFLYIREKQATRRATAAQKTAQTEASKSRRVAGFLQDMLAGVGPSVAQGRDTTIMRDILARTEKQIAEQLNDQPEVAAQLYLTMAGIHDQLGDYPKAEALCREAIRLQQSVSGPDAEPMGEMFSHLGSVQTERGDLAGAETSIRRALSIEQSHPDTAPEGVIDTRMGLVGLMRERGDLAGAEKELYRVLALATNLPEPQQTLREAPAMNVLGLVLWNRGDLAHAEICLSNAVAAQIRAAGEAGPEVAQGLGNLGLVRWERGDLAGAEQVQRRALELKEKNLGLEHPSVANSLNNLAIVLRDEGDLAAAEKAQRRAVAIELKAVGENHPDARLACNNLEVIVRRRAALSGDTNAFREALALNPTDPLAADGFASLLAEPSLTPLAEQSPTPEQWRFTASKPPANWAAPDFSDGAWASSPGIFAPTSFVPRSDRGVTPRTNLWLRQQFQLGQVPTGKVVLRLNRDQGAEVYLNGVLAAPAADWSDAAALVPCADSAAATLHPGRNVLAIYCDDADGGAQIGAALYTTPDPTAGRSGVIEELGNLIEQKPQRAELYVGRAGVLVHVGRMEEAARDMAKAIELEPGAHQGWYALATLLASTGEPAAYMEKRSQALARFTNPSGPPAAQQVALLALMMPAYGPDLGAASALADRAASVDSTDAGLPERQLTEGLAKYRRGEFAAALDWTAKVLATAANPAQPGWAHERARNRIAAACFVQAMACQGMHEPVKARAAFSQGVAALQAELPVVDAGDPGRNWPDTLAVRVLMHEAKATIQ